ncbi:MAG: class II aldolase/adducin family protein [Syntrophomonadaceae bacterium]|nr:class II aldolase/adducin family protein [Syntrophomonadaceae bacterium]MDH7498692.1 class II aldolase/adducin family protein [Syntrophomonadaceae bacterium]
MEHAQQAAEVVATAKAMFAQGLVVGTWGNVSQRLPGAEGLVITPSGMAYERLTPGDMVVVDMEGRVRWGRWRPSSELPLHLAVYAARGDVNAVVHVHSVAASAFAVARLPVPPVLEEAAEVLGGAVEVADYALCGTRRLAEAAVRALGERNAVLLANHGLVGVGADAAAALRACVVAEKTAQVVLYARMLGTVHALATEDVERLHQGYREYARGPRPLG